MIVLAAWREKGDRPDPVLDKIGGKGRSEQIRNQVAAPGLAQLIEETGAGAIAYNTSGPRITNARRTLSSRISIKT